MADSSDKILKKIRPSRIIFPILLGLIVVGYLLYKEFDPEAFSLITFSWYMLLFIFISLIMMFIRDFGYIIRLRILTEKKLSWRKSFNIIMLWEFTSAITPGAIGGTSVAVVFIHKEGLTVGKSTAVVMATSLLDELYFIILFPIIVLVVGNSDLFTIGGADTASVDLTNKYFLFAVVAYSIKFLWILFMSYGLFINPGAIKKIIVQIFKLRFLKKWKTKAENTGNDLIMASNELKKRSFTFWAKAFLSTFFSWTARYWVLNFLLLALIFGLPNSIAQTIPSFGENLLIFARQLVMWLLMVIIPTPGGSGIVELVFSDYMAEFIPALGLVTLMAILWRLVTYYPYLFIGVLVLPKWIKRVFAKSEK